MIHTANLITNPDISKPKANKHKTGVQIISFSYVFQMKIKSFFTSLRKFLRYIKKGKNKKKKKSSSRQSETTEFKFFIHYFAGNLQSAHKMWGSIFHKLKENLMEHINRVEIRGNVGMVRLNEHNGKKVANISVATELLYKSREGIAVSEKTWHNVVAWSGKDIADLETITKGTPIHVVGRIKTSRYTSADGTEKFFYEVAASRLMIVRDAPQMP